MQSMSHSRSVRYPVGVQTFEEIREEGYIYVDKTGIIHNLVDQNKYVFLSRPRRFGKSLLMSTLEAYFEGRKELFEGLAIEDLEHEWTQYPVLHMDLSQDSYDDPENLLSTLSDMLAVWEARYNVNEKGNNTVARRFANVIRAAAESTGRKVVVLVDEYDKPILSTLVNAEVHNRVREKMQGVYSVIKASDKYIHFAMITGVSKFAHLSVFSGANNFNDISFDLPYNAICGISENEMHANFGQSVKDFASGNGISEEETWAIFKNHYDGYHFALGGEDIYNPFSVLCAFSKEKLGDYWFQTGTPSFLIKLVQRNDFILTDIEGSRESERDLMNVNDMDTDIVPFLFQAGYLTIKGWDDLEEQFILDFPNKEVERAFWDSFRRSYFPRLGDRSFFSLSQLTSDIDRGDATGFMEKIASLIASTPSESERNKEIHFQNMMAIICKMLGYRVRTEIHSSMGRCDMEVETSHFIYIFEFKVDGSARDALDQIKERGYTIRHTADPRRKILIGANFSTRTRTLDDYIIDRAD